MFLRRLYVVLFGLAALINIGCTPGGVGGGVATVSSGSAKSQFCDEVDKVLLVFDEIEKGTAAPDTSKKLNASASRIEKLYETILLAEVQKKTDPQIDPNQQKLAPFQEAGQKLLAEISKLASTPKGLNYKSELSRLSQSLMPPGRRRRARNGARSR